MTDNLRPRSTEDPLDIEGLSAYCGGKKDFVQKLLDAFVQVGPLYFKELSLAVESGKVEETRTICHKIRGAGSVVRAELLLEIVAQIRQSAIDVDFDRAKALLPDLEKAFSDVADYIKKLGTIPPR